MRDGREGGRVCRGCPPPGRPASPPPACAPPGVSASSPPHGTPSLSRHATAAAQVAVCQISRLPDLLPGPPGAPAAWPSLAWFSLGGNPAAGALPPPGCACTCMRVGGWVGGWACGAADVRAGGRDGCACWCQLVWGRMCVD
jgi:hypothetical protein